MGSTSRRKGAGPDTCWGVRARPYGAVGRVLLRAVLTAVVLENPAEQADRITGAEKYSSHQPKTTPMKASAPPMARESGCQLCGLKKPSSPASSATSASSLSCATCVHPPGREGQVVADHDAQAEGQEQRGGTGGLLRPDAVDDRHGEDEDGEPDEHLALDLHLPASLPPMTALAASEPWGFSSCSSAAISGWCRSNAGDSERIRGSVRKLCRGGGQDVAHSSERP